MTVIFPMTDLAVELLGEQQDRLRDEVILPVPSLDRYHQLSDKYQLTAWAEKQGIPVPDTIFVPDGVVATVIDRISIWPVVVKPGRSLLKVDGIWKKTTVLYAHDPHELRQLYQEVWYLAWPSMIQQRIVGEGQGVFGLFDRGNPLALFSHRRLRERPPSGGVSVLRESICLPEPMTDYAVQVAQSAEWQGISMVEFKVDRQSQIPYLMEVNGRFWGSLQLAIDAGVDFPWLLYQLTTTGSLGEAISPYQIGIRSRWWLGDLDHMLLRWWKSERELALPPGSPSRWITLWNFINVLDLNTKSEVFRVSDLKPGIYELMDYCRSLIHGAGGALARHLSDLQGRCVRVIWNVGVLAGVHRWDISSRFPRSVTRVLVLCKGNICRSPFADRWLHGKLSELNIPIEISSAGLDTTTGKEAYPLAMVVSRDFGIDLRRHRTTMVSKELVMKADVILVMEVAHIHQLLEKFPNVGGKTFLLGHFSEDKPITDIRDPYGCASEEFVQCYRCLVAACQGFIVQLQVHVKQYA